MKKEFLRGVRVTAELFLLKKRDNEAKKGEKGDGLFDN